jgi:chromosome segregation protein
MKLRQLDIIGFKSFKDRTTLRFAHDVAGVVGPNGCGKSNIVDAMLWSLGEMSPKSLRGKTMDDVIFNGSENHSPLSRAEVRLTFEIDPTDNIPEMYKGLDQIVVGRITYRNVGGSEYTINGHACRQRDVLELFMNTGVGSRGYAIIEQGRIGMIVTAKPEERRRLLEEAAGIALYRSRRLTAERKMEATQANLESVQAIIDELNRHLGSLKRQAAAAERYKSYRDELMGLELNHAAWVYRDLVTKLTALREGLWNDTSAKNRADAELATAERTLEARKARAAEVSETLKAARDRVYGLRSRLGLTEQAIAHADDELLKLEQRRDRLAAEKQTLTEQTGRLTIEDSELSARATELQGTTANSAVELSERENAVLAKATDVRQLEHALEAQKRTIMDCVRRATEAKGLLADLERRQTEAAQRRASLDHETAELDGQLATTRAQFDEGKARLEARKARRAELQRAADQARIEAQTLREAHRTTQQELLGLRDQLARKRSRHHSLVELQNNYEGYEKGVRAVMAHREGATGKNGQPVPEAKLKGIRGLVTDLIETPAPYVAALEAALGDRLQYIVVDELDAAVEALTLLKSKAGGRSSFVPLNGFTNVSDPGHWPFSVEAARPEDAADVVGELINLVKYDPAHEPIVRRFIGHARVVKSLDAAVRIRKAGGYAGTLVTLDGEVLDASGVLAGGSTEEVQRGFLQRKNEIKALASELEAATAAVASAESREASIRENIATLDQRIEAVRTQAHDEEKAILADEKDQHRHEADLMRLSQRRQRLVDDLNHLERTTADVAQRAAEAASEAERLNAVQSEADARQSHLTGELAHARAAHEQLSAALTQVRVSVAQSQERQSAVTLALANARRQLRDAQARLQSVIAADHEADERISTLARQNTLQREQCAIDREALTEKEAEYNEAHHQLEALNIDTQDIEAALRRIRENAATLAGRTGQMQLRLQQLEFETARLVERISDAYELDVSELPVPERASTADEEARITTLREAVAGMKNINLNAIEEYERESTRLVELTARHEELSQAIQKLKRAILKINRVSVAMFEKTFEEVNRRFSELFPRLFNGGSAKLILIREEGQSVLDAGIEIVAQPPGKRLTRLSMMSGGERALTAMALVFSIFLIKPSPFCILDEVDAPLDDSNVGRFNRLLREMSARSQFIVITHNKATMATADMLYGITMQEPGVSSAIPFELKPSERAAAEKLIAQANALSDAHGAAGEAAVEVEAKVDEPALAYARG